ncbi:carbohydrate ABC transporter permease [Pseudoroseicyclus sp. H15]
MTRQNDIWRHGFLLVAAVFFMGPLLVAIFASFKTTEEMLTPLALPNTFYLGNYREAFADLWRPLINSVLITVPAVALSILVGCLAAFPLSQMGTKSGRWVYIFLLLGMFIPFQIIQIPIFFIVRALGLYDTIYGLWVVHLALGIPFCTFFMRNYFATVPRTMWEAAQIDGCGATGYFFKILMPASISGIAALAIVQSRGVWNDLLFALTLTRSPDASPVTRELYGMVGAFQIEEGPLMASAIVSTLPMVLVFLLFQKAFTRGLLGGSSK